MKLYHFTARRFEKGILRDGLTLGRLLVRMEPEPLLKPGWQWLTSNPSFDQAWAEGTGRLPYKRNECRFTVSIPAGYRHHLKPWSQVRFLVPDVAEVLSSYGDPENWHLYEGSIPPGWLRMLCYPPTRAATPGAPGQSKEGT